MRIQKLRLVCPLLLLVASCRHFETFTHPSLAKPENAATGSMTAVVNVTPWNADRELYARVPRLASFFGVLGTSESGRTIEIQLTRPAIGLQELNAANDGYCRFSDASGTWDNRTFGSGTVLFSELTEHHAVGSFTCFVIAIPGGSASGNRSIADGRFDLTF